MSDTYKLNRTCPTCGKRISDKNKSGYCNRHRDRTGSNNPFYGKTHSQETINSLKEKCSIASTKKWGGVLNMLNMLKKGLNQKRTN